MIMDKMNGKGLDLNLVNIEKLKEIFPAVVSDGKVDFDLLKIILGEAVDTSQERYKFEWVGRNDSLKNCQTPSSATLIFDEEKSHMSDTTKNIYIEGDNLEVLKCLLKTYYGRIKMIYIDPPYNTGEDFVYEDDFKEGLEKYLESSGQQLASNPSTGGRYHTKWLNMMLPRLQLAQRLLSEDGAMFISIDDNELTRLKMLCDFVFGESNFCAQISVKSNPGGRDYGGFAVVHDYLLVYTKTLEGELNMLEEENKEFPYRDEKGGFSLMELRNRNIKFNNLNRPNLYYPFYINPNIVDDNGLFDIDLVPRDGWVELYPQESQGIKTVWRWGKEKALKFLNTEIRGKRKQDGGFQIIQKYRSNLKRERTIWDDTKYRNEAGSLSLKALFDGKKPFDYPKSVDTILNALKIGSNKDSLIMDFFSGSATTAEAVFKLNSIDGGSRQFILVQLPEKYEEGSVGKEMGFETICDAGEERVRRAGSKIKEELKREKENAGLFSDSFINPDSIDFGFKVFKLNSSNILPWDGTKKIDELNIFEQNQVFKEGRTKLDVVYEIMLKYGVFDKKLEEKKINGKDVFCVDNDSLVIFLEDDINMDDIKEIIKLNPTTVVFKESGFADDNVKMNAEYTLRHYLGEDQIKVLCI